MSDCEHDDWYDVWVDSRGRPVEGRGERTDWGDDLQWFCSDCDAPARIGEKRRGCELHACDGCNRPFWLGPDDMTICGECFDHIVSSAR